MIEDHMYAVSSNYHYVPQRYNFATRQWQSFAKISVSSADYFYYSGATSLSAKVYVLYCSQSTSNAELSCFDPVKNKWEVKATTCQAHFGSSLIVVNNRLCVVGGNVSLSQGRPYGSSAPVEPAL